MIRALLVDLDGTLIDSLPSLRAVYERFLARRNIAATDAEFDVLNGPPLARVVQMIVDWHQLEGTPEALMAEYVELLDAGYVQDARLAPGAEELLTWARARSMRIALVTSAPLVLARAVLKARGVESYFDVVIGGDSVTTGKPAPDGYLLGLENCGVAATEAVAVEDSGSGVRAAVAAGIVCVALGAVKKAALLQEGAATVVPDLFEARRYFQALADGPGRVVAATGLRVRVGIESRVADSATELEIGRLWDEARRARSGLSDGNVVALSEWVANGHALLVTTEIVPYRYYVAQRAGGRSMGIFPLGVTGVVRLRYGELVLGRRGRGVTQYPGHWELVPSGGIPAERVNADGVVDAEGHLLEELREELGIGPELVRKVVPLGLIEDAADRAFDLAYLIETDAEITDIVGNGEYEEFVSLPRNAVGSFRDRGPWVPSVQQLLELLVLQGDR